MPERLPGKLSRRSPKLMHTRESAMVPCDTTPPTPVFASFGSAVGLALGELALALGKPEEIERTLWRAYVEAKAALLAHTLR
jgi:hypothetical protein